MDQSILAFNIGENMVGHHPKVSVKRWDKPPLLFAKPRNVDAVVSQEEEDLVPLVWEVEEEEDHTVVVVLVEGVDFEVDLVVVQMEEAAAAVFEGVAEVDLPVSNHNHHPEWVECPDPDSIMDPDKASTSTNEKQDETNNE
jgi:hypothetical protein